MECFQRNPNIRCMTKDYDNLLKEVNNRLSFDIGSGIAGELECCGKRFFVKE